MDSEWLASQLVELVWLNIASIPNFSFLGVANILAQVGGTDSDNRASLSSTGTELANWNWAWQKQAEAELCQAQVKLEVMFEVELNVGVEVVVEGTLKLWL